MIIVMERNRWVAKVCFDFDDDYDDDDDNDICSHISVIWWHDDDDDFENEDDDNDDDDGDDDDDDICSHISVIWWHAGKIAAERAWPSDHSSSLSSKINPFLIVIIIILFIIVIIIIKLDLLTTFIPLQNIQMTKQLFLAWAFPISDMCNWLFEENHENDNINTRIWSDNSYWSTT